MGARTREQGCKDRVIIDPPTDYEEDEVNGYRANRWGECAAMKELATQPHHFAAKIKPLQQGAPYPRFECAAQLFFCSKGNRFTFICLSNDLFNCTRKVSDCYLA